MSAVGKEDTDKTAVAELTARFTKKGKVIALSSDDQEAFANFADVVGENNYRDWTKDTDSKIFTGLAMVRATNDDDVFIENRLIAIPSEEAAFADPVVRKAMYRMFTNRIVNAAEEDDANPASFLTVAGCFKQKFDLDAFKFQAKALTAVLRKQGLSGIKNNSLRMSFESAAFAKTLFSRVSDEEWVKLLDLASSYAAKNGYDTSIFDHWKATRNVQSADTSEIKFDFAAFDAAEEAIEKSGDETATPKQ